MMKKLLLLSLSTILFLGTNAQECSELFFSEYIEGSHNNKALEIYNPTQSAIDLGSYRVVRWSNGSNASDTDPNYTQPLSGSIQPLSTYIIAQDKQNTTATGQDTALFAELLAICQAAEAAGNGGFYSPNYTSGDVGSKAIFHNGNDAISLQKTDGSTWNDVDIFGVIGEKPTHPSVDPAGWSDVAPYWDGQGTFWTKNHTLIRKTTVKEGVSENPGFPYTGAFNPSVEYDSLPENTFSNLGSHDCDCASVGISEEEKALGMSVYPNPSNGEVVSISTKVQFNRITLMNMLGMTILEEQGLASNKFNLSTERLDAGIYMIQLGFEGNQVATRKLIIR